ncbi:hypothetical protein CYMTET_11026, partial [Cymbomonas tetramitiformis]
HIYYNSLTGTLPTELLELTILYAMHIYYNSLTGTLPTELLALTILYAMHIYYNSLTGTLPTELLELTILYAMDLYSNSLTGTLPTELGEGSNLIYMNLDSNSLTGTLPTELGELTILNVMYFHYNSLTGTLPTELGELTFLNVIGKRAAARNGLVGAVRASTLGHERSGEIGLLLGAVGEVAGAEAGCALAGGSKGSLGHDARGAAVRGQEQGRGDEAEMMAPRHIYYNSLTGTLPTELLELTILYAM